MKKYRVTNLAINVDAVNDFIPEAWFVQWDDPTHGDNWEVFWTENDADAFIQDLLNDRLRH
jgi:hypothetical protein